MKFILWLIMEITYIFSRPKKKLETNKVISTFSKEQLKAYAKELTSKWTYVHDGLRGALNYIHVPEQASLLYEGDCDDYASHMYYRGGAFNPYLLTYFPKKLSRAHTIVVYNLGDKFLVINWNRVTYHDSLEELYEEITNYCNNKVISYHWAKYNYTKSRFYSVKAPKLYLK